MHVDCDPKMAAHDNPAADPKSKAETEMKQAKPPLAKPPVGIGKPNRASHADTKGPKSR
jgi:hypothetical protein